MYKTTASALKELRKIGRENNHVFKQTSELHNGNVTYAFYSNDVVNTSESTTQSLKNWRDDLCNSQLNVNFIVK